MHDFGAGADLFPIRDFTAGEVLEGVERVQREGAVGAQAAASWDSRSLPLLKQQYDQLVGLARERRHGKRASAP
jgi:hypothetical protein